MSNPRYWCPEDCGYTDESPEEVAGHALGAHHSHYFGEDGREEIIRFSHKKRVEERQRLPDEEDLESTHAEKVGDDGGDRDDWKGKWRSDGLKRSTTSGSDGEEEGTSSVMDPVTESEEQHYEDMQEEYLDDNDEGLGIVSRIRSRLGF